MNLNPTDYSQPNITVPDFQSNETDSIAKIFRMALGYTPVIGPVLSELINDVIPNQQNQRIIEYIKQLDLKLLDLAENFLSERLKNQSVVDLFLKGGRYALFSTEKKIKNISSICKNGI